MRHSKFGEKFSKNSGILELMEDLDQALNTDEDFLMLGGGNPGQIDAVNQILNKSLYRILNKPGLLANVLGNYDNPKGESKFIDALVALLNESYSWNIQSENIALTNGSQNAFFSLFNVLAGEFQDGSCKKILLPLNPEYIGYTDTAILESIFCSQIPDIEYLKNNSFRYKIPFSRLDIHDDISAMCLSRPTNPTGKMASDLEMQNLSKLARQKNIPLIVDNAYGLPFPGIVFSEASPSWDENTILSMSLSKFGLPGARTGIVIADPEIIKIITRMNAIHSLACGSIGPAIALDLIEHNQLIETCNSIIQPHYQQKSQKAIHCLHEQMQINKVDYLLHKNEGSFFLWLWLTNLGCTTKELYQDLKQNGVIIVPGEYYFPGLESKNWDHKHECIRISFSQDIEVVQKGLKIIAQRAAKYTKN